jgi:tetratricopeptide (TPR) repeat protein
MYSQALTVWQDSGQMNTKEAIAALDHLGEIFRAEGKYAEAEPLLKQALEAKEHKFGSDHLDVAAGLSNLALLYYCEGNYDAAEPLYKRAVEIRERNLGPDDPAVLQTIQFYAAVLRQEGRSAEAASLENHHTTRSGVVHPKGFEPLA